MPRAGRTTACIPTGAGEIALRQMRQNGVGYHFFRDGVGMWTTPHGHSFMGDYHDDEKLVAALDDPAFAEYLAALKADKGEARTREILAVARWNSNVWPNLSFMSRFRQLRVVHSGRGRPHRGAHLLVPHAQGAAGDVRGHDTLRQTSPTAPARRC